MFELIDKRYKVNGRKLRQKRERLNLSQAEFAYACDWTTSYQCQLENGHVETVSEATKNVIEGVINGFIKKK